ncbi:hypothetical protein QAD02_005078 [Eretmocerus hayati]|uniref:Uncharacterized protein n=1 Tax=Eretmocerus hayati TaxID=131215 RepID=A0ACC2NSF6_9HYME|nr:hypothetical protein QAD02_005078 [Eretmocerus hayati]
MDGCMGVGVVFLFNISRIFFLPNMSSLRKDFHNLSDRQKKRRLDLLNQNDRDRINSTVASSRLRIDPQLNRALDPNNYLASDRGDDENMEVEATNNHIPSTDANDQAQLNHEQQNPILLPLNDSDSDAENHCVAINHNLLQDLIRDDHLGRGRIPQNSDTESNNEVSDGESNLSDDDNDYEFDLKSFLREWSLENNITLTATSKLLAGLILAGHSELPKDARTLLNTPTSVQIIPIGSGSYAHYGLLKAILEHLECIPLHFIPRLIRFDVHIDGVTVSKSSESELYTILGHVNNCELLTECFTIGAHHGTSKPEDVDEFLRPFLEELRELQTNGFMFKDLDAPPRTSLNFRAGVPEKYLDEVSPIEDVVNPIDDVPLEPMHQVYLGQSKKHVKYFVSSLNSMGVDEIMEELNEDYKSLKKWTPMEFGRKPRTFAEYGHFKAEEFRTILLYTGPVIFSKFTNNVAMEHFNSLNLAIREDPEVVKQPSRFQLTSELRNVDLPEGYFAPHKSISFENFTLTCSKPDNCCSLTNSNSAIAIHHICKKTGPGQEVILFKKFTNCLSIENYPIDSREIEICKSNTLGEDLFECSELKQNLPVVLMSPSGKMIPLARSVSQLKRQTAASSTSASCSNSQESTITTSVYNHIPPGRVALIAGGSSNLKRASGKSASTLTKPCKKPKINVVPKASVVVNPKILQQVKAFKDAQKQPKLDSKVMKKVVDINLPKNQSQPPSVAKTNIRQVSNINRSVELASPISMKDIHQKGMTPLVISSPMVNAPNPVQTSADGTNNENLTILDYPIITLNETNHPAQRNSNEIFDLNKIDQGTPVSVQQDDVFLNFEDNAGDLGDLEGTEFSQTQIVTPEASPIVTPTSSPSKETLTKSLTGLCNYDIESESSRQSIDDNDVESKVDEGGGPESGIV